MDSNIHLLEDVHHTTTPITVGEIFRHGANDLSPVFMDAALHFDTWVPNFGVHEFMPHSEEMHSVFPHDYRFERGMMHCGESPGHGVDIDEKLAAKYPYQRAYLPVNRLQHDGTLWNW